MMNRWFALSTTSRLSRGRVFAIASLVLSLVACGGSSNTKPVSPVNSDVVHKKIQLGKSYLQNGNFERARFHLRDALQMAPESAEVYDALALMFMATDELELADEYFQKALARSPDNSRYRNNYASYLFAQQRCADAEVHFQRVVDDVLYENRTDAMASLARCKSELGDKLAAKELFAKVLKFNRLHPVALFYMSQGYLDEGDLSQAYTYWQRLSMTSRESAASLLLGIKIAEAQGRKNDAASMAIKLSSLFGQSQEYKEYNRDH